jgi:hypothetical protein
MKNLIDWIVWVVTWPYFAVLLVWEMIFHPWDRD